jgi:hypothetical protein
MYWMKNKAENITIFSSLRPPPQFNTINGPFRAVLAAILLKM